MRNLVFAGRALHGKLRIAGAAEIEGGEMRQTMMAVLLAGLATGAAPQARANDAAAAIAAGVVGVAVGAALANSAHHHQHHDPDHFSPKPGVVCYPRQRACYHADGSFASHMTWEIYR